MKNFKRFGAILAATVITTITIPTAAAQEDNSVLLGDASAFEASETYTAEVISRIGDNAVLQIELPDGTIETVFCLDYDKGFYSGNKYTFKGSEVQDVTKVQDPEVTDEVRSIVWDAGGMDGTTWRDLEGDELYAAMQVAIWIAANGETRTDYWGREVPADYCDGGLTECQRGWELYKDLKSGELEAAPDGLSLEVWEPQDDPTLQSVIRWTYEGPTGDEVNDPEPTTTEPTPVTETETLVETTTEVVPTTVTTTETEEVEVPTTTTETKVEEVPTTVTETKEIPTTAVETTTSVVTETKDPVTETVTSKTTVTQEPETLTEVVTETVTETKVESETETVTDVVEKEVTVTETVTPEPEVTVVTETITHDPVTETVTTEVKVPVETTVTETETTEAPATTVTVTEEPAEEPGDEVETTTITEPKDESEVPIDEDDKPTFTINPDVEIVVNIEDAGDIIQSSEKQEVSVTGPEIVIPRLAPAGVEIPTPAQAEPRVSAEEQVSEAPSQGVKRLAETGANIWWAVGAGAALLLAGAGLMVRRNK